MLPPHHKSQLYCAWLPGMQCNFFFDNFAGFWERVLSLHSAFLHLFRGKTKFSLLLKGKQWICVLYSRPVASNSWYVLLERQYTFVKKSHLSSQQNGLIFWYADKCLHPSSNGKVKRLICICIEQKNKSIDHEKLHCSGSSTVVLSCNKDLTVSGMSSNFSTIPSRYCQEYSTVPYL